MERTHWAIDGDDDTVQEIQGRKFSSGDSGEPMLCSIVCTELGRHVHLDFCRADDGGECLEPSVEHVTSRMQPEPNRAKDWITHELFWARAGLCDFLYL